MRPLAISTCLSIHPRHVCFPTIPLTMPPIPAVAIHTPMTPQNGKRSCRFLPLLPPITRNVTLPIPTTRLESRIGRESRAESISKSGKNGNVHRASQHCHPTTALSSSALGRWPVFSIRASDSPRHSCRRANEQRQPNPPQSQPWWQSPPPACPLTLTHSHLCAYTVGTLHGRRYEPGDERGSSGR